MLTTASPSPLFILYRSVMTMKPRLSPSYSFFYFKAELHSICVSIIPDVLLNYFAHFPPPLIFYGLCSDGASPLQVRPPHLRQVFIFPFFCVRFCGAQKPAGWHHTTRRRLIREFESVHRRVWKGLNGLEIGLSEVVISPDWRPLGPI